MTTYTYNDAYLAQFCTTEREARAIADVELMTGGRTLTTSWTEKLVTWQTYVLACREEQAAPDDLFAAKLKLYQSQLAADLPQAIIAADEEDEVISSLGIFSVPLYRS